MLMMYYNAAIMVIRLSNNMRKSSKLFLCEKKNVSYKILYTVGHNYAKYICT